MFVTILVTEDTQMNNPSAQGVRETDCITILQRNRPHRIYTIYKEVCFNLSAHAIMEAEKFYQLLCVSWRPRKGSMIIQRPKTIEL